MPFPESPRLLLAQGKADEFKKALDMLARWNGKTKIDWDLVKVEAHIESQRSIHGSNQTNSIVPFALADMPIPFRSTPWTIEISNLPTEAEEPALRRLLTSRLGLES